MGSSKPASAAGAGGPPQPPAAVCCMCGDHGLLPELFRCAACSFRSQHTYCTDRYPQADSYGTCNWCLRADRGSGATSSSPRSTVKAAVRSAAHGDATSSGGGGRSAEAKVAARRDFAANLNKPIKKQQQHQQRLLLRRSASDLGSRVRTDHDAPPSPGVGRGRPRIRRYKLLEELITNM